MFFKCAKIKSKTLNLVLLGGIMHFFKSIFIIVLFSGIISGCGSGDNQPNKNKYNSYIKSFISNHDTRYNNSDNKLRVIFGNNVNEEWGIAIDEQAKSNFLYAYEQPNMKHTNDIDLGNGTILKFFLNTRNNKYNGYIEYKNLVYSTTLYSNQYTQELVEDFIEFADNYEKSSKIFYK